MKHKSISKAAFSAALLSASLTVSAPASAGPNEYLGEVMLVGFNFCPRGTAAADGTILPINQNQSLYSLYGTTFGGDGRTSFGLPDLRGRIPIHTGSGPGLTPRALGSRSGSETNTMTEAQMPSHTHRAGIQTRNATANQTSPRMNSFAHAATNTYVDGPDPSGQFMHQNTVAVDPKGSGQSQNNMQPFLTMRYCVNLTGTFPSRN